MKFEYDDSKENRECVAYIDIDGDLNIKTLGERAICFSTAGLEGDFEWSPDNATHKFYPGDKVTITF